ncbi:MAG: ParB/RepB/Spo0J family partition protein [Candidatus Paralactobacillus gallistercoris]|uniref:ParB/RepB/Spo0J family partition protein n=1 Tax=Candidatus Paralactobacillus gallistercoris TaxID=2838724 RepID=A0A948TIX4_9LACO|nr:ParB/RepB/Spo0J family partition protein [Candidatus Paralactobacillus gallistercoris]
MKKKNNQIDQLFADLTTPSTVHEAEQIVTLPLAEIRPNPYQPRRIFATVALQDLANSITKSGVFQPIIVRQSISGYELVAGERRFRASKLAGKQTIPAIIRQMDDDMMMEVAVLENLQRENLTPLEEANAYATLMKKLHLTQAEISNRLGKSRPYIANYLRLLTLPMPVKQMIQKKQLSMGQARTLLGLKDKTKITRIANRVVAEKMTVRQLEQLVNQENGQRPKLTSKPPKSPYLHAAEEQLSHHFDTKVNIVHNQKGTGKIEINYLSLTELNRILQILNVNLD